MTNYPQPSNKLPDESQPPVMSESTAENWIKTIYRLGFIAVTVLSAIYAISPVDAVPDVLVGPGQVDDAAVVAAGGTSIGFMTMLRFFFLYMIRQPRVRRGCMIVAVIGAIIVIGLSVLLFFSFARFIDNL